MSQLPLRSAPQRIASPFRARLVVYSLRVALLFGTLLLAAAALPARGAPGPVGVANAPVAVAIAGFAYRPEEVRVAVGTTVEWTNNDAAPHDVVSDDRVTISSRLLATGERFSQRFDQPGSFDYFCTLHPSMRGTVVVVERPQGSGAVFLPLLRAEQPQGQGTP